MSDLSDLRSDKPHQVYTNLRCMIDQVTIDVIPLSAGTLVAGNDGHVTELGRRRNESNARTLWVPHKQSDTLA